MICDPSPIVDPAQKKAVAAATEKLKKPQSDLKALEFLVEFFERNALVLHHEKTDRTFLDTIGTNVAYGFADAQKREAYDALRDWYSIEFLEKAMTDGSAPAKRWALRTLMHQGINSRPCSLSKKDKAFSELVSCGGLVTERVVRRLTPTLGTLMKSPDKRVSREASRVASHFGVLVDRKGFLKALRNPDEDAAASGIVSALEGIWVDPGFAEQVWRRLATAKTDGLRSACLYYDWLFEIEAFDDGKRRTIMWLLENFRGGFGTNLNTRLVMLAMSDNPLAKEILLSLGKTRNPDVKERVKGYMKLFKETRDIDRTHWTILPEDVPKEQEKR
jgi:hypothetical protein